MAPPYWTYKIRWVVIATMTALPSFAAGQAPRTIGFQGILTTPAGDPVPDGKHSMTFAIYDDSVGGAQKWIEMKTVATTNGMFNTELGSDSTITGFPFDTQLWLGMAVDADPEMSPRVKLTSVPTALALAVEPKLTYTSVDATAFAPTIVDNTSWYSSDFSGAYIEDGTSNIMDAAVELPDGVKIKELSAYIFDVSTSDLYCTLNVIVHDLVGGTKTSIQVVTVNSSGSSGWDWYSEDTLSGLTPATIENSRMFLAVFCQAVSDPWTTVNSDLRIGGVVVAFEAPSP